MGHAPGVACIRVRGAGLRACACDAIRPRVLTNRLTHSRRGTYRRTVPDSSTLEKQDLATITPDAHAQRSAWRACIHRKREDVTPSRSFAHVRHAAFSGLLAFALLGVSWQSARAQDEQEVEEARGFIDRIAGTVFKWAWPSATYEQVRLTRLTPVENGFNAVVRLSGQSYWTGLLWMDLVFMLRDGRLADLRVMNHNAKIAEPFSTAKMVGGMIAGLAESYVQAPGAATPAPRPTPASYTLQVANDCHLPIRVWLSYRTPAGEWLTRGYWDIAGLGSTYLLENDSASDRLRVSSRVVYSYAALPISETRYAWAGETRVPYGETTLEMRADTLIDDGTANLVLARNCSNLRRLGVSGEDAKQYMYNGTVYTSGARILEVQPGYLAERIGLRSGDVIYNINGQVIENWEAFVRFVVVYNADSLAVNLIRDEFNLRIDIPADVGR